MALAEGLSLAMKVVANYGLSPLGIAICAPPAAGARRKKNSHEVAVDDLDSDLTRGIPGGGYQACDESMAEIRKAAQQMVREAYATDCVSSSPLHEHTLSCAVDVSSFAILFRS
jgi:hypothetical protein